MVLILLNELYTLSAEELGEGFFWSDIINFMSFHRLESPYSVTKQIAGFGPYLEP